MSSERIKSSPRSLKRCSSLTCPKWKTLMSRWMARTEWLTVRVMKTALATMMIKMTASSRSSPSRRSQRTRESPCLMTGKQHRAWMIRSKVTETTFSDQESMLEINVKGSNFTVGKEICRKVIKDRATFMSRQEPVYICTVSGDNFLFTKSMNNTTLTHSI